MNKEEQLIVAGEDAEVLLQSEALKRTVESLAQQHYQNFCNSDPIDVDKREISHRHYRSLVDVINTLKQAVVVKNQIIEKNEELTTSDDTRPMTNEEAP